MINNFLPLPLEERLRKLGFQESCLAIRADETAPLFYGEFKHTHEYYSKGKILWQQAVAWFNETYKIRIDLTHSQANGTHNFTIWRVTIPNQIGKWDRLGYIGSYPDIYLRNTKAIEAAIKLVEEDIEEKEKEEKKK